MSGVLVSCMRICHTKISSASSCQEILSPACAYAIPILAAHHRVRSSCLLRAASIPKLAAHHRVRSSCLLYAASIPKLAAHHRVRSSCLLYAASIPKLAAHHRIRSSCLLHAAIDTILPNIVSMMQPQYQN